MHRSGTVLHRKTLADAVDETLGDLNAKQRRNCVELQLSNKDIEKITGAEEFPQLEVLWANDNPIHSVHHLKENFRLKELYLHNCKIETLVGSDLPILASLEVLLLRNNEITDLKKQVNVLGHCPCLRQLDLSENPCCNESDARHYIIFMMPWVAVLDRHVITEEEHIEAKRKSRTFGWLTAAQKAKKAKRKKPTVFTAFLGTYKKPPVVKLTAKEKKLAEDSECEQNCAHEAEKVKAYRKKMKDRNEWKWSHHFGVQSKPAPMITLQRENPEITGVEELPVFQKNVRRTVNRLNRVGPKAQARAQSASTRRVPGDVLVSYHTAPAEPYALDALDQNRRTARPESAMSSIPSRPGSRLDDKISFDPAMFEAFNRRKAREAASSRLSASRSRPVSAMDIRQPRNQFALSFKQKEISLDGPCDGFADD